MGKSEIEEQDLFNKMDEIMKLNHQITSFIIDIAQADFNGQKIKGEPISLEYIENNKIIQNLFLRLQEKYRELQELIENYNGNMFEGTDYEELSDFYMMDNTPDLYSYLQQSYADLRYVPIVADDDTIIQDSIFRGDKFESIHNIEFNNQVDALDSINERIDFDKREGEPNFQEKYLLLKSLALEIYYKHVGINQVDNYISLYKELSDRLDDKEYQEFVEKLFGMKYALMYRYLNNKYNGLMQENDIGRLGEIKNIMEEVSVELSLGMTTFEVENNVTEMVEILKKSLDEEIQKMQDMKEQRIIKDGEIEKAEKKEEIKEKTDKKQDDSKKKNKENKENKENKKKNIAKKSQDTQDFEK